MRLTVLFMTIWLVLIPSLVFAPEAEEQTVEIAVVNRDTFSDL